MFDVFVVFWCLMIVFGKQKKTSNTQPMYDWRLAARAPLPRRIDSSPLSQAKEANNQLPGCCRQFVPWWRRPLAGVASANLTSVRRRAPQQGKGHGAVVRTPHSTPPLRMEPACTQCFPDVSAYATSEPSTTIVDNKGPNPHR